MPPFKKSPQGSGAPSPAPAAEPSTDSPPPVPAASPPPLPLNPNQKSTLRHLFAMVLSLFVGLFLIDAVVSLADDSLILFFDSHALTWIRGLVAHSRPVSA